MHRAFPLLLAAGLAACTQRGGPAPDAAPAAEREAAGAGPEPANPPPANPHLRLAIPPVGPESLACVDRELARRGLNAWGDPAGTAYPDGPPTLASEVERERMLLERYPDVAVLCRVPP